MALTRFGFIVTGDDFVQWTGTEHFRMKVVGVKSLGIQLIELCGGFSPVWAGKIIEAIDYAVPVGVVAYGPESISGMYRLFPE